MKAVFPISVLFIYLCLGLVPSHADGIYKWIDQHGVIHYSDRPSTQHPVVKLGPGRHLRINIGQPPPDIPRVKSTAKSKKRRATRLRIKPDCERFRAEIRKIESTLRQGYTEPTGSRMRQRKRDWTARLQKQCY